MSALNNKPTKILFIINGHISIHMPTIDKESYDAGWRQIFDSFDIDKAEAVDISTFEQFMECLKTGKTEETYRIGPHYILVRLE